MADLNTVHDKVQIAMDESDLSIGVATRAQQVQALNDQISSLQSQVTALQGAVTSLQTKITNAQAALA